MHARHDVISLFGEWSLKAAYIADMNRRTACTYEEQVLIADAGNNHEQHHPFNPSPPKMQYTVRML